MIKEEEERQKQRKCRVRGLLGVSLIAWFSAFRGDWKGVAPRVLGFHLAAAAPTWWLGGLQ